MATRLKRFWTDVALVEGPAWGITLDEKTLKTPAGSALLIPSEALALAILAEWADAGTEVDPRAMPLTGLANVAIDRVGTRRTAFAATLSRYADSDLLCYRAETPRKLVERQNERWDPLLDWARQRYDVEFAVTSGVLPVAQPTETGDRLAQAVVALDDFAMAGMSPLVTIGGSLIAALALLEDAVRIGVAWDAVSLDEQWQIEQWGADAEAVATLANRQRDFESGDRFLKLLRSA